MTKRFKNALAIQDGACNALAVTNALVEAIREARAAGVSERVDPACRLIAHQLAFLLGTTEIDAQPSVYVEMLEACEGNVVFCA